MKTEKFNITGMSCASCASKVTRAVEKVSGVNECNVNLLTNSLTVTGEFSNQVIMASVRKSGYGIELAGDDFKQENSNKNRANAKQIKKLKIRLFSSLGVLVVLMYLSMFHQMFGAPIPKFLEQNSLVLGIVLAVLSLTIMCINYKFFVNGFKGAIKLSPNMDTLVALGSFVSFIYSLVVLIVGEITVLPKNMGSHLYFDSAGMILVLVSVGKTLEAYSKGKTTNALNGLIKLIPKIATKINEQGEQQIVDVASIKVGDIVLVKSGEDIPVDGVIIEGSCSVNQASLTGESMPVLKQIGSQVYSATINLNGVIKVRVTQIGEDTNLSKIIKMVSDASASKAPVSKIADKVSGVFVPIVLAISIIATAVWLIIGADVGQALSYGISVLVVSCPCALGLATPVAIMVGSGVGAKHGILYKSATDMETLGKCSIIALDKTGTITQGLPTITDIIPAQSVSEERLIKTAMALESNSIHPLAKAICDYGYQAKLEIEEVCDFVDVIGKGVKGYVYGSEYYVGSLEFIESVIPLSKLEHQQIDILAKAGKTPILVCSQSEFLGIIALKDKIKDGVKQVISRLKKMKITPVMITGDNQDTALAIAKEVGIDRVISGVLPQQKGEIIGKLQAEGKVIMVGDGINDALALTVANTGIAVGNGTDIAIDAGDVVLLNNNFNDVFGSIRLSKVTLRVIYQNLFWALIYNLVGIPLAFGAFSFLGLTLSPMFCAGAMSVSSILVVCNALRINLLNIYKDKNSKVRTGAEEYIDKTIMAQGLMCNHCVNTVCKALLSIDGVASATADYVTGKIQIKVIKSVENLELISAVENNGFKVNSIE